MGSNPTKALDRLYDELSTVQKNLTYAEGMLAKSRIPWDATVWERAVHAYRRHYNEINEKIEALEAQLAY